MFILCELFKSVALEPVAEGPHVCEACAQTGDRWMHLRKCLSCGAILCCHSSPKWILSARIQYFFDAARYPNRATLARADYLSSPNVSALTQN